MALADDVDAVVYTATGDTRPDDALADLVACLRAGRNVVSTAFYPLLHPASAPRELLDVVEPACARATRRCSCRASTRAGRSTSCPRLVSGVSAGITEIRVQELFNYALYDQPDVVREVIGFGGPMDEMPLMLLDFSLEMVWAPMVRILADLLERRARARSTPTSSADRWSARSRSPGMGTFEAGHAGRVPLRGARHRRRPSAAGDRARHPHRRRLRARVVPLGGRAASTGC